MRQAPKLQEEAVAKALGAAASRRILAACIRDARPVREISERTGLPIASVYRQVGSLVDSGVMVVERSAMTADGKPYDLYRSRITRGRIEVSPDRVKVTWEVNAVIEDHLVHMWTQLTE